MVYEIFTPHFYSLKILIDIAYVSKCLGHINIQTTQNYYLELMSEKKHQQDDDALNLLNSLSS